MSATFNPADVWLLLPELTVAGCATAVLILDFCLGERVRTALGWFSVLGLLAAGVLAAGQVGQRAAGFSGMLLVDPFAVYFKVIFLVATLLIILMAMPYLKVEQVGVGEFYAITLYATAAMMLMGGAGNLLSLYVALETMSVSIYVLCGYLKRDQKSNEAALKYLLMGVFSSGVILYGMVMLYGLTGTLDLREVGTALKGLPLTNPALVLGMVMLTAGFGFKIAMVPFHMYIPDVYEGAPTPVTAYIAVAAEAAGFAAMLRVFLLAMPVLQVNWTMLFWVLAALTMTVGNVVAVAQTNIKRMLAYSGIAHVGYTLIGLVAGTETGISAMLLYILAYYFMTAGAFAVVVYLCSGQVKGDRIEDFSGLAQAHPAAAFAMLIFLLSLTGIPPTVGFVGKFYLFSAAIEKGFVWLAVIAVVNSVISLFYYMRVVMVMYMRESPSRLPVNRSLALTVALVLAVLGTLVIGVYPEPFLEAARASIRGVLG